MRSLFSYMEHMGMPSPTSTHDTDQDYENNLAGLHAQTLGIYTPYLLPWWSNTHRENAGTLGMVPKLFSPPRSPLKGDLPNKYI